MYKNYILIFLAVLCIQCNSDSNSDDDPVVEAIRLLKTYEVTGSSNYKVQLFYNDDKTLDYALSVSSEFENFIQKFIYEDGKLVRSEIRDENNIFQNNYVEYTYINDQIFERRDLYDNAVLDETYRFFTSNNRIDRIEYYAQENPELRNEFSFVYDMLGNVTSETDTNFTGVDYEFQYSYDDKTNPFKHIDPYFILWEDFPSRINNPTKIVRFNITDNTIEKTTDYTYIYDERGYPTQQSDGTDTVRFTYY